MKIFPWAAKQNFNQPEDAFTHKLNQFFIAHLFYHNKFLNKMLLSYSVWFPLRFLVLLNFHSCFYKYEKYRNFNIRSHVWKKLNKKVSLHWVLHYRFTLEKHYFYQHLCRLPLYFFFKKVSIH